MSFSSITQRAATDRGPSDFISATFSSGSVVVGKAAFVVLASTNRAIVNGPSNTHLALTSLVATNTWEKLGEYTQTSGVIGDGTCLSIWASLITSQITAGSDNLRMSFSGIVSRSIMYVFDASISGSTLNLALAQLGVGPNVLGASVGELPSREYLLIGAMVGRSSDTTKTPDADYVERHDATDQTDFTIAAHIQTRIATLTSDTCSSTDWTPTKPMSLLAAVYEQSTSFITSVKRATAGTTDPRDTTNAKIFVAAIVAELSTSPPSDSMANVWRTNTIPAFGFGHQFCSVQLYYVLNPITSASHTFTFTGTAASMIVGAWSSLLSMRLRLSDTESNVNTPGGQPGPITTVKPNGLVVTAVAGLNGSGGVPSSINLGFLIPEEVNTNGSTNFGLALAYRELVSPATVNPLWTFAGGSGQQGLVISGWDTIGVDMFGTQYRRRRG